MDTEKPKPKRGGKQPGAGRPKNSKNKINRELQEAVASTGITPLEFLLKRMRAPCPAGLDLAHQVAHEAKQFEAAVAAAPYVHSKLSAVQVSGGLKLNHEAALNELE
jgi:hypothetical protein